MTFSFYDRRLRKFVQTKTGFTLEEAVRIVLKETLGIDNDEAINSAKLKENLGAESIDLLDIIFRLEKRFEIKIPRGEEKHWVFVEDIIKYIRTFPQWTAK